MAIFFMAKTPNSKDQDEADYDDAGIARRRDEVVKRMLNTPPKPKTSPKGKAGPKPAKGKPAK
jgi:hypothetical protein